MKPPQVPWFHRLLADAYARRLGMDPEKLHRMATGAEPWDNDLLAAIVQAFSPLTSDPNRTKDRYGMEALSRDRKTVVGRPMENDHPFARWLKGQGLTLTEWAYDHGYKRERVKSWIVDGSGARPVSRDAADKIAAESKGAVPATRRTWRNGIKE